ncbi:cupin domain-containing protein [Alphaproteobacteria bacterium]|nr:cupin domain-containing protein [Alphaproteobacteria bacterium]
MNELNINNRLVRYGELIPCKTAFIDTHTPGSDQKENFTIIGSGVSENSEQHVHISIPHGFNIGAAGQPPKCNNSLHSHRTAEVFFVLSGRWRFFWGRYGNAGEVILEKGDIFNIPTGIFRGFENIGESYGMLMAILGGDDAGGGVIWAPEVLSEAKKHGLILSEKGKIYDTLKDQQIPNDENEMKPLKDEELKNFPEYSTSEVVPYYVARYLDLYSLSFETPCKVIGEKGKIYDKPGFEVEFISDKSKKDNGIYTKDVVFMPVYGYWRIKSEIFDIILNPGDTFSLPKNNKYILEPIKPGIASIYKVIPTDDKPGSTQRKLY